MFIIISKPNLCSGGFFGIVRASQYLDANGKSMMTDGQWNPEYLNIKGLRVGDLTNDSGYQTATGVTTIVNGVVTTDYVNALGITVNAANITGRLNANQINMTGAISWPDLSSSLQGDIDDAYSMASDAQTTADLAETIAKQIANGTYSGGTFIDGTKMYSPTIYSNEFNVYPKGTSTSGSYNLFAYDSDNELCHFSVLIIMMQGLGLAFTSCHPVALTFISDRQTMRI